jgi:formate dehydrogenase subunit delta
MTADKLVHMANQIAAYFRAYPAEAAVAGIRDHIVAFWTPGMVVTLIGHARISGAGLDPLVAAAVERIPHAPAPVATQVAGPDAPDQSAGDAG